MEGDFRRPAQRPSGQPRQQPSHRPASPHLTDLRAHIQPNPAAAHSAHPAPPRPADTHFPEARPAPEKPTTAELIAKHQNQTAAKSGGRRSLILAAAGLAIVIVTALVFLHRPAKKPAGPFPAAITASQVTIPVYYPKGLPDGFKVSSYKVVKQDVLNYAVTNKNSDSFYVNIQAVPAGYDFAAFNKRFKDTKTYPTDIGTATIGTMGSALVCSIQTAKSWVLINSTALKDSADMATIAKSLQPASLN